MTNLDFHLQPLKKLQLSAPGLESRIRKLDRITAHLTEVGNLDTEDQIAELRSRVRQGYRSGRNFDSYTSVRRRESRLLSLYLMDLGDQRHRELLPPFDRKVAASILGESDGDLKRHVRRAATQLYFTHYGSERIKDLAWLADRLRSSWQAEAGNRLFDEASKAFHRHADILFTEYAPTRIARQYRAGESFDQLAARFAIPNTGEFRERLLEEVILERLRKTPSGEIAEDLDRIVFDQRERLFRSRYPLGAEAVRILIDRSLSEFQGKVPRAWKDHIVTYACDPRVPSPTEQDRWWGWANQRQKETAIRALTELTLRKFISLLEASLRGTSAESQFERRASTLLRIFDTGKVNDARLAVHEHTYWTLPEKLRRSLMLYRTSGGPQHTSFVILRCTDDVYLVEGTHSFALRAFIGADRFPLPALWRSQTGAHFRDGQLRINERRCDIYLRHQGHWPSRLVGKLRRFHIEWRGIY